MEETHQQEIPDEDLLRIVYTAGNMEIAHKFASVLMENNVHAYILPDPPPCTPAPYDFLIPYKVRVAVPIDQESEALIILEAYKLKIGDIIRTATSDFRRALIWSIEFALFTFAASFLYHRNIWEVDFTAVMLVWISSFFILSLILGHIRRKPRNGNSGS